MAAILRAAIGRGLSRLERLAGGVKGPRQAYFAEEGNVPERLVDCVASSFSREVVIDIGGNPVEIDGRLFFRASQFITGDDDEFYTGDGEAYTGDSEAGPLPVSGSTLNFPGKGGTTYRVITVSRDGAGGSVTVTLADEHSGR